METKTKIKFLIGVVLIGIALMNFSIITTESNSLKLSISLVPKKVSAEMDPWKKSYCGVCIDHYGNRGVHYSCVGSELDFCFNYPCTYGVCGPN